MKSIIDILNDNDVWDIEQLITFSKQHNVRVRQLDTHVMLTYEDQINQHQWNDYNRQCRGIIINLQTKTIIAHPFNKFFNLDGHPEVAYDNLPMDLPYCITEKYDGSMVTAYGYTTVKGKADNQLCFATKGAFKNEFTGLASEVATTQYPKLATVDLTRYTLIFELLMPNAQIVTYTKEDLILIGVRDLNTQQLLNRQALVDFASTYDLCLANQINVSIDALITCANDGEQPTLREGWVVSFDDGLMMKIKTWQYLAHLYIKEKGLSNPQLIKRFFESDTNKWQAFINQLPKTLQQPVIDFANELQHKVDEFTDKIHALFAPLAKIESKKTFAITVQQQIDQAWQPFIFKLRANKSLQPIVQKKYDMVVAGHVFTTAITLEMVKGIANKHKHRLA